MLMAIHSISTVETLRVRDCAAANLFPISHSVRSSWQLSISTTETSKCYQSGFLTPSPKMPVFKNYQHTTSILFTTIPSENLVNHRLLLYGVESQHHHFYFVCFKEKSTTHPSHLLLLMFCSKYKGLHPPSLSPVLSHPLLSALEKEEVFHLTTEEEELGM